MTLIELLIACALSLGIVAATLSLLESSARVQGRDGEWALTLQEDRAGVARMVREVRQATKVEEAKANAIEFLGTLGGKKWEVKYECSVSQPSTSDDECVRTAAEEGKALPASGQVVAKDLLNGTAVFSYSPSSAAATATTVRVELPAQGTLREAGSKGYRHDVVLEDVAFMRNLNLLG